MSRRKHMWQCVACEADHGDEPDVRARYYIYDVDAEDPEDADISTVEVVVRREYGECECGHGWCIQKLWFEAKGRNFFVRCDSQALVEKMVEQLPGAARDTDYDQERRRAARGLPPR